MANPLHERVVNDFKFHPATDTTGPLHAKVRERLRETAFQLIELGVPEGRELSTCLSKLEEAMFWANAAIARAQPS